MRSTILAGLVFSIGFSGVIQAGLIKSDFLSPGDQLLVTDTATSLTWLAPLYTKAHGFDDAFVQNVITTYGFAYATEATVLNMINTNFNNPPLDPGDANGFTDAVNFFAIFGINDNETCGGPPPVACPRTQGLTSDSQGAGFHDAVGMIQFSTAGWLIEQNSWPDSVGFDPQMGSWLVLKAATGTPEPASFGLIVLGFGAIVAMRRRRTK